MVKEADDWNDLGGPYGGPYGGQAQLGKILSVPELQCGEGHDISQTMIALRTTHDCP